ncbi:MAG: HAD-IIB family hydrolase, partial [Neisseriaceae bacterium]
INWMPQKFDISNIAHVNKICLMGDNEHLIDAQKTLQSIDDSLLVAFSHPNYLELATKDISKYSGLMKYAQKLDIKANEIIAFGDGENDIPMLSNVGLGVAMDNASAHVKKIAKDIASHHMEEGVAIYLEELIAKGVL